MTLDERTAGERARLRGALDRAKAALEALEWNIADGVTSSTLESARAVAAVAADLVAHAAVLLALEGLAEKRREP